MAIRYRDFTATFTKNGEPQQATLYWRLSQTILSHAGGDPASESPDNTWNKVVTDEDGLMEDTFPVTDDADVYTNNEGDAWIQLLLVVGRQSRRGRLAVAYDTEPLDLLATSWLSPGPNDYERPSWAAQDPLNVIQDGQNVNFWIDDDYFALQDDLDATNANIGDLGDLDAPAGTLVEAINDVATAETSVPAALQNVIPHSGSMTTGQAIYTLRREAIDAGRFGLVSDAAPFTGGYINADSLDFRCVGNTFTPEDVGKQIYIPGAGPTVLNLVTPLWTTIETYVDVDHVVLADPAANTVGKLVRVVIPAGGKLYDRYDPLSGFMEFEDPLGAGGTEAEATAIVTELLGRYDDDTGELLSTTGGVITGATITTAGTGYNKRVISLTISAPSEGGTQATGYGLTNCAFGHFGTDNYAAFTAAKNQLSKSTMLLIPAGDYLLHLPVLFQNIPNLHILGLGAVNIYFGSDDTSKNTLYIPTEGGGAFSRPQQRSAFVIRNCNYATIENIGFTGGNSTNLITDNYGSGVYFANCLTPTVRSCRLGPYGGSLWGQSVETNDKGLHVVGCYIYGARSPNTCGPGAFIEGNYFDKPTDHDYDRSGQNGSSHDVYIFAGNPATSSHPLQTRNGVRHIGNYHKNSRENGIKFSGSSTELVGYLVQGNTFDDCRFCCTYGADNEQPEHAALTFSNNVILAQGILSALGCRTLKISDNHWYLYRKLTNTGGLATISVSRYITNPRGAPVEQVQITDNLIRGVFVTSPTSAQVLPAATTIPVTDASVFVVGQVLSYTLANGNVETNTLTGINGNVLSIAAVAGSWSGGVVGSTGIPSGGAIGVDGRAVVPSDLAGNSISVKRVGQGSSYGGGVQIAGNMLESSATCAIDLQYTQHASIVGNTLVDFNQPIRVTGDTMPFVSPDNRVVQGPHATATVAAIRINKAVAWPAFDLGPGGGRFTQPGAANGTYLTGEWGVSAAGGAVAVDFPLGGRSGIMQPSEGKGEVVFAYGADHYPGDILSVDGATTLTYHSSLAVVLASASITSGSPTITAPAGTFSSRDVGKYFLITDPAGRNLYYAGQIIAVASDTSATASGNAPSSGSSLRLVIGTSRTLATGSMDNGSATLAMTGELASVRVVAHGRNYTFCNPVVVGGGPGSTRASPVDPPHPATVTANIVDGKITSYTVTDYGKGYVSTPTIDLSDSDGEGAQGAAAMNMPTLTASDVGHNVTLVYGAGTILNTTITAVPGTPRATVQADVEAGETLITVNSTVGFQEGQDVWYRHPNNQIEFNTVAEITSATELTLTNPLGEGGGDDNVSIKEDATITVVGSIATLAATAPTGITNALVHYNHGPGPFTTGAGAQGSAYYLISALDGISGYEAADYGAVKGTTTAVISGITFPNVPTLISDHIRLRKTAAGTTTFYVTKTTIHRTALVLLRNGTTSPSNTTMRQISRGGEASGPGTNFVVWSQYSGQRRHLNVMADDNNTDATTLLAANPGSIASRDGGADMVYKTAAISGSPVLRWEIC